MALLLYFFFSWNMKWYWVRYLPFHLYVIILYACHVQHRHACHIHDRKIPLISFCFSPMIRWWLYMKLYQFVQLLIDRIPGIMWFYFVIRPFFFQFRQFLWGIIIYIYISHVLIWRAKFWLETVLFPWKCCFFIIDALHIQPYI